MMEGEAPCLAPSVCSTNTFNCIVQSAWVAWEVRPALATRDSLFVLISACPLWLVPLLRIYTHLKTLTFRLSISLTCPVFKNLVSYPCLQSKYSGFSTAYMKNCSEISALCPTLMIFCVLLLNSATIYRAAFSLICRNDKTLCSV